MDVLLLKETMLMNKVEFYLKVVVLLVTLRTYWVMCYASWEWRDGTFYICCFLIHWLFLISTCKTNEEILLNSISIQENG